MQKQLLIWQLIQKSLKENIPIMLLYVVESKGSSPGRQGFFMAVNKNGEMEGSIGGGIMEHKFVEMAKEKLQVPLRDRRSMMKKQIHDKSVSKNQSGMICSGEQTIWLYNLQAGDISVVENLISCLNEARNGQLELCPDGISFSEDSVVEGDFYFEFKNEENWLYKEKVGYKNILHIIGGGHCALAFSKIMSMMDFYIHLYDTRTDLNTMIHNQHVRQRHVIKDYAELKEIIPAGKNHFVVVMTFGYRTDEIAVQSLISKQFRYFGLLGSSSKIKKLLDHLNKNGYSEQLKKIHAPVGLPINSQTPEEIAISIASEIIQVKNSPESGVSSLK
jgi:xanthine dehydrogenase accessory factor